MKKAAFAARLGYSFSVDTETAFSLQGKRALITGGGSGIGAAICREFARAGAVVEVADLNLAAAQAVAAELPSAVAVYVDVADEHSVEALAAETPTLDILVNNAGIGLVGDLQHTAPEDFERIMRVNVTSVYLMTRALLPQLLASRGSVLNIASVAGLVGIRQRFAYCASKGAVVAMTRQLAVDYPKDLRVNCICPGTVDSPFVAGYLAKYHAGEEASMREQLKARQPVGRLGQPEEVASLARYACSAEADFLQGAVLNLDGGWTAA